jgi:hypothetical protein
MNSVTQAGEKAISVDYENFTNRTSDRLAKLVLMITIPILASVAVASVYTHISTDIQVYRQVCQISTHGQLPHCLLGIGSK